MQPEQKVWRQEPFGAIAVRKGFVTRVELDEALRVQKEMDDRREKHKLIGILLLEMGSIATTQLIEVLQEMDMQRREKEPACDE